MEETQPEERAPDAAGFWSWFAARQAEILDIVSGRRTGRVTDLIDQALAAHGLEHLTYEVTSNGDAAELIFTPSGDLEAAAAIDEVIQLAPRIDGWRILGRIEPKPLATALGFVQALHGVDLSHARLKLAQNDGRFDLCFLDDALFALPEDLRYAVAGTFLDHAVGEQFVMDRIGQLEFRPSGEGVAMGLLINALLSET